MKKIKLFSLFFLVIVIVVSFSGCVFEGKSDIQAEMAEKLLNEKYGEEFVVEFLGSRWGTATDGYYVCNCYPKSNKNLKFQAIVDKDCDYIEDEYATKIAEVKIVE